MKKHAITKFGRKPRLELIPGAKANIRPVHKATLLAAKVATALNIARPEPMGIIRKREKELPSLPYRKPEVTLGTQEKVGRAVADWDNSDPFAYGRAVLHVKQGFINADETIKELTQRTIARRVAKAREVEAMKAKEVASAETLS